MASVFLSYAREDAAVAKALAKSLERAGHSVWWDRHIRGGSEYAGEIESALRESDVVVVLWTDTSVRSAWVRDEAAEGRDTGRIVPVALDRCRPPLGFRQLQTLELAGWSGRGNPPRFRDLLEAIAARSASHPNAIASDEPPQSRLRRLSLAAVAVAAAVLVGLGAWWLIDGRSAPSATTPVLAVLPFSDLSPRGDKAYFTEGVSEAILTILAREPGLKVLGRSTTEQIRNAGPAAPEMHRALGITHVLEGSARSSGDQLRVSVRLVDAADGQQLWAEEYHRRLDNIFAVQDEIGRAVAKRLKGRFSSLALPGQPLTSADAYTLYLAARAKMRDRRTSSLQDALRIAQRVIAADPRFAPAHALYAEAIWHLSDYGDVPQSTAARLAEPKARRAIELAPDAPEGYAALGLISLRRGDEAAKALEKAIALDPGRAELRLWLATTYDRLGRHEESLEQVGYGLEMEPLWWPMVARYSYFMASSGRFQEAFRNIDRYVARGGSKSVAARIRGDVAAYYRGDVSEAIRHHREAWKGEPDIGNTRYYLADSYYLIGLTREAAALAENLSPYARLQYSGQAQALLERARNDGARVWDSADPEIGLNALTTARDWAALELAHDAHSNPRQLCSDHLHSTLQMSVQMAQALQERGRDRDADRLLRCVEQTLERQSGGKVRSAWNPGWATDFVQAEVDALRGRVGRVFPLLRRAAATGLVTPYGHGLADFPPFDRFRGTRQYAQVDAMLKQVAARERAEALRLPR